MFSAGISLRLAHLPFAAERIDE